MHEPCVLYIQTVSRPSWQTCKKWRCHHPHVVAYHHECSVMLEASDEKLVDLLELCIEHALEYRHLITEMDISVVACRTKELVQEDLILLIYTWIAIHRPLKTGLYTLAWCRQHGLRISLVSISHSCAWPTHQHTVGPCHQHGLRIAPNDTWF